MLGGGGPWLAVCDVQRMGVCHARSLASSQLAGGPHADAIRNSNRTAPLRLLQKWVNSVGKAQGRKGKRLFMPMRICFTGRMQVGVLAEPPAAALALAVQGYVIWGAAAPVRALPSRCHACESRQKHPLTCWALLHPTQGPDVGEVLSMLALEDGDVAEAGAYVPLAERMQQLQKWVQSQQ